MSQFADGRRRNDRWSAFGTGRRRALNELRFIHRVVTTQEPVAIDDARTSDAIEAVWVERFGLKSVLGVPLIPDDQVLGVLVLDTVDAVRPFGVRQHVLAQAVADQLALFIQKRLLVDRLAVAERLRETEGLLTLAAELGGTLDRVELARAALRYGPRRRDTARRPPRARGPSQRGRVDVCRHGRGRRRGGHRGVPDESSDRLPRRDRRFPLRSPVHLGAAEAAARPGRHSAARARPAVRRHRQLLVGAAPRPERKRPADRRRRGQPGVPRAAERRALRRRDQGAERFEDRAGAARAW